MAEGKKKKKKEKKSKQAVDDSVSDIAAMVAEYQQKFLEGSGGFPNWMEDFFPDGFDPDNPENWNIPSVTPKNRVTQTLQPPTRPITTRTSTTTKLLTPTIVTSTEERTIWPPMPVNRNRLLITLPQTTVDSEVNNIFDVDEEDIISTGAVDIFSTPNPKIEQNQVPSRPFGVTPTPPPPPPTLTLVKRPNIPSRPSTRSPQSPIVRGGVVDTTQKPTSLTTAPMTS